MRIYLQFRLWLTIACDYLHGTVMKPNQAGLAMPVIPQSAKVLKGRSFGVPELILMRSWSEAAGLRMVVRLDHGSDAEDYEEVLAFHQGDSPLCHWIMWRSARTVFIQPLIGRVQRFDSVACAFEAMAAKQRVVVTDIKQDGWPA